MEEESKQGVGDGNDYGKAKKPRKSFWRRKWSKLDMLTGFGVVSMHCLCALAPFHYTRDALGVAWALAVITGPLGVTLSYHRNLAHKSFKLPKWLEYFFAYCGALAFQHDPIEWVSDHRYHHQYVDTERDPHSPHIQGFWYSHIGWIFDSNYLTQKLIQKNMNRERQSKEGKPFVKTGRFNNVHDLQKQPYYRFLRKTYPLHHIASGVFLYKIGGLPYLTWGMGVRIVFTLHVTFCVNSICHIWGKEQWRTNDLSKNNWLIGLLACGEGWHNNHHAFEYSARHGIEWWQIDFTWFIIMFLEAVGLATEVKLPSEAQKKKMAL